VRVGEPDQACVAVGSWGGQPTGPRLLAVLCNPSLRATESTTSWRNVKTLAAVLGSPSVRIANLIEVPTRSTTDLAELADQLVVDDVRPRLSHEARSADLVVVGWGTRPPRGWPIQAWRALVTAAAQGLTDARHEYVVHVGVGARHPSRWRQHTSPIHARYDGETFEARLQSALHSTPLSELVGPTAAEVKGRCAFDQSDTRRIV
jgi:hypothetical protein